MLARDRYTVKVIHKGILLPQWAKLEDEDLSWLDKGTMAAEEDVARECGQDGMPFQVTTKRFLLKQMRSCVEHLVAREETP